MFEDVKFGAIDTIIITYYLSAANPAKRMTYPGSIPLLSSLMMVMMVAFEPRSGLCRAFPIQTIIITRTRPSEMTENIKIKY